MPDIKITLDEFFHILDDPITRLVDDIERVGLEHGIPIKSGVIREVLEDAIEDIHIKDFVKNKGRKFSKWVKRKLHKIRRIFK